MRLAAPHYLPDMNLEDHLGDIVRKGRMMTDIASAEAARAAGLSVTELTSLEETGKSPLHVHWEALAKLIGLDGTKLKSIAGGWLPKSPGLDQWRHLRQISTEEGGNTVHCYVVWDETSRQAAIFDTGWEAGPIFKLISSNKLEPKHLFITHTHHDHVAGMKDLRGEFPDILVHTDSRSASPEQRNHRSDRVELGSMRISNRSTPGHAEDGVTYVIDGWPGSAPPVAIVGDTIFAGSMGRGNSSWDLARTKVREEILTLPAATLLCPGHGPMTTVAEEKEHNPFF